jgi:hypothetical protein
MSNLVDDVAGKKVAQAHRGFFLIQWHALVGLPRQLNRGMSISKQAAFNAGTRRLGRRR